MPNIAKFQIQVHRSLHLTLSRFCLPAYGSFVDGFQVAKTAFRRCRCCFSALIFEVNRQPR